MTIEGEQYTHGHSTEVMQLFALRTAEQDGGFFLPYLSPGMRLLDVGCGTGSITVGLAEVVSPGEVVGIDVGKPSLETARAIATEKGVSNVSFETGNAYELPYPDDSFDAVFSHMVLEHLDDPDKALLEIRRVLKSGGVVGLRDADQAGVIVGPEFPLLEELLEMYERFWQRTGGDPYTGRKLKAMLHRNGFVGVKAGGSVWEQTTPETIKPWVDATARRLQEPDFVNTIIELGWTDRTTFGKMIAELKSFTDHPDSFIACVHCEAVGWKE